MAEVGSWYVTVLPNMRQFNRALQSAASSSGSAAGGIFNTAFGVALGNLASGAIRTAFGSLESGISRLDTLETFPRVMENIGVATEDVARGAVQDLAGRLEGLPTRLDDATAAVQRFALQNGDINASVEMFDALNNALLAGGAGADLQASALEQVSQAYAKGKPDMMEWRSMLQTMGPALQMVAASWGMSVDEMGEALRSGEVPIQDFFDTLITLNDEGIAGMASLSEQASVSSENLGTALGLIPTRLSNAWAQILDAIGREDLVAIVDGATSGMLTAVQTYIVPAVEAAKQAFDDFAAASQPIQDAFSELVSTLQEQFAPAFEAVAQAIADNLPTIEQIVDVIAGVIQFVTDNIEIIETFAVAFLAFQAISAVVPIVLALGSAFAAVGTAIATLAGAGSILGGLLGIVATIGTVPVIVAAVAGAIALLIVHFDEVKAAFETFKTWLSDGFEALKAKASEIVDGIASFFVQGVAEWRASFEQFVSNIQAIPGRIVGFFSNIGTAIGAKFTELKTRVISAFQAVITFVQNIPGRIIGFFSGIGSRITSAIGNIKFPTPHVSWESTAIPGLSLPKIQWYAQGGFVNGAQLIGAGEKGTELIWPSYGTALDRYGAAIASHMDGKADTEELIYWLARNLGPIINEYAPRTSKRELNRVTTGAIYV